MTEPQLKIAKAILCIEYADGTRWEAEMRDDDVHRERIDLEIEPGEVPVPDLFLPYYRFANRTNPVLEITVRGLLAELRDGSAIVHG